MKKLLLLTSLFVVLLFACNNSKLNKSTSTDSASQTPHGVNDTTIIPKDTSVSKVILKDHGSDQQAKIDSIKAEKNKKKRKDN